MAPFQRVQEVPGILHGGHDELGLVEILPFPLYVSEVEDLIFTAGVGDDVPEAFLRDVLPNGLQQYSHRWITAEIPYRIS